MYFKYIYGFLFEPSIISITVRTRNDEKILSVNEQNIQFFCDFFFELCHSAGVSVQARIILLIYSYTDFAKAFDRVDHNVLVKKLSNYGLSFQLFKFF